MARMVLTVPGEDVDVGGTVTVVGTATAGETITVIQGNVTLDASFNRGGDTIVLPGETADFNIRVQGSQAILTNGAGTTVVIPLGPTGADIAFDDQMLELRIDASQGAAVIGGQRLTGSAETVTGLATAQVWTASQQTYDLDLPEGASAHEYMIGDFNGDGLDDILMAFFLYPLEDEGVPMRVLLSQGDGTFEDGTEEVFGDEVPETVHPRGAVVADFNGDGRADVFIADHGYDAMPFPGAQNRLLLSTSNGLVDASENLPELIDYSHSTTAGDVDGDGDVDLVVMNLYGGSPPEGASTAPYILLNDGSGEFTRADDLLPAEVAGRVPGNLYTSTLLFDADGDDDMDLFLGAFGQSEDAASRILFNPGNGDFSDAEKLVLPHGPFGADEEWVMSAQAADLNGDGHQDLLLTINHEDQDPYLQLLMGDGEGGFMDRTSIRLPQDYEESDGWIHSAQIADMNGDGSLDILARELYRSPLFLNDGRGNFTQVDSDEFDYGGWGTPQYLDHLAIDTDGDGQMEIVADSAGTGFLWTFTMDEVPIG